MTSDANCRRKDQEKHGRQIATPTAMALACSGKIVVVEPLDPISERLTEPQRHGVEIEAINKKIEPRCPRRTQWAAHGAAVAAHVIRYQPKMIRGKTRHQQIEDRGRATRRP